MIGGKITAIFKYCPICGEKWMDGDEGLPPFGEKCDCWFSNSIFKRQQDGESALLSFWCSALSFYIDTYQNNLNGIQAMSGLSYSGDPTLKKHFITLYKHSSVAERNNKNTSINNLINFKIPHKIPIVKQSFEKNGNINQILLKLCKPAMFFSLSVKRERKNCHAHNMCASVKQK